MKPATPLPWNKDDFYSDEYAHREEDIAYGVHAANAYPLLVEALKGAAHWVDETEQLGKIDALLRELGE